jgi:hypothetical protein
VNWKQNLENIVEPDYGLPEKLYSSGIIEKEQCDIIIKQKSVGRRVFYLLQAVEENWGNVKVEYFLQSLKEEGQCHVVNFIKENGEIDASFGDLRPLNEQQRRRLTCLATVRETLDLCGGKLLDMLQNKNVLSARQVNDIMTKEHSVKRNKRLLRILSRRNVADLKQFIESLDETNQHSVVQLLTEVGAVIRISTTIDQSQMLVEDILAKQKQFVLNFSDGNRSNKSDIAAKIRQRMEVVSVNTEEEHIAWYIMCRTVQSCDHLRYMYKGPSRQLINIFRWIFNCLSSDEDNLLFSMKWSDEDYGSSRSFLTETSGRTFELTKEYDEVRMVPEMTVCQQRHLDKTGLNKLLRSDL